MPLALIEKPLQTGSVPGQEPQTGEWASPNILTPDYVQPPVESVGFKSALMMLIPNNILSQHTDDRLNRTYPGRDVKPIVAEPLPKPGNRFEAFLRDVPGGVRHLGRIATATVASLSGHRAAHR